MYLMRSLCNTTNTRYFKWVNWKLPGGVVTRVLHWVRDVELAVDMLQQAIFLFYAQNSPARVASRQGWSVGGTKSRKNLKLQQDGI
jgi:hypothetical protein